MIELPGGLSLALNLLVWPSWSLAVGYIGHRRAVASFARERWWSALLPIERDGAIYARGLQVKRWKDLLPELGGFFPGGFAKRSMRNDRQHLQRFAIETRRAEWVHWIVFAIWPVFALWNPPWAVAVMFVYATAANLPCIVVQRYNRARLLRVLKAPVAATEKNPRTRRGRTVLPA